MVIVSDMTSPTKNIGSIISDLTSSTKNMGIVLDMKSPTGGGGGGSTINLSKRGETTASFTSLKHNFLDIFLLKCLEDSYDEKTNPEGFINMGTAENFLVEHLMVEKFREPGFLEFNPDMCHYFKYEGSDDLLTVVAKFFDRYFKSHKKLNPEHFVMVNGTSSALDNLTHALADPGDVFLSPAPYYARIHSNLCDRSLVSTFDVPYELDPKTDQFLLTVSMMESGWLKARQKGLNVKGIVIINPSNPLGIVFSQKQLMPVLEWAKSRELFVIIDEIYALSYFDKSSVFESAFSYPVPDPMRTFRIWGFSKDFGLAGLRISTVHSENPEVLEVLVKLSIFNCVPPILQVPAKKLLSDYKWLDEVYLPTNKENLETSYQCAASRFEEMKLPYLHAKGGFFIFVDFSSITDKVGGERKLFDLFIRQKVYLVPGSEMRSPFPGWFRIVFCIKRKNMEIGLDRIQSVVEEVRSSKIRSHL